MQYFTPFPVSKYKFSGKTAEIDATDITRRFALTSFIFSSEVVFDSYTVKDGERPDTVAYDYYDDESLDWVILLTNEIKDPYFSWALSYEQFNQYLIDKYGSVEYALKTPKHYEKIIQRATEYSTNYETIIIPERKVVVDYNTYASLIDSKRRIVTIYDYEFEINERNRQIFLLDLNLIETIRDQHPTIFDTGSLVR